MKVNFRLKNDKIPIMLRTLLVFMAFLKKDVIESGTLNFLKESV